MKARVLAATVLLAGLVAAGPAIPASAAPTPAKILFYGPSLTGDEPLNEAKIAQTAGYDVRIADEDKWLTFTTEDFATYDAIVVGDPACDPYENPDYMATVQATRDVWSPAVTGNVIVIGSDPMYHQRRQGAVDLTRNAMDFAASGGTTGMYFSLSCNWSTVRGYHDLKVLNGFGSFEIRGQGRKPFPNCPDSLRVTDPAHPAMEGLTDALLSNWHCSAHEAFDTYPEDFVKLVGETHSHKAIVIGRTEPI
jgi:hypothetical protein